MIYNWRTEKSLTAYPLIKGVISEKLIIDANFIQFDGFIPVLKTMKVTSSNITLTILFDIGEKSLVIPQGSAVGSVFKIYDGNRFLGKLVLGSGFSDTVAKYDSQTLQVNDQFLPSLVRSIPSKSGVFSINQKYGNVEVDSNSSIYWDITGNDVTFNAVTSPTVISSAVLKTINNVEPINNNLTIKDGDLLKVSNEGGSVVFRLIDLSMLGTLLRS